MKIHSSVPEFVHVDRQAYASILLQTCQQTHQLLQTSVTVLVLLLITTIPIYNMATYTCSVSEELTSPTNMSLHKYTE